MSHRTPPFPAKQSAALAGATGLGLGPAAAQAPCPSATGYSAIFLGKNQYRRKPSKVGQRLKMPGNRALPAQNVVKLSRQSPLALKKLMDDGRVADGDLLQWRRGRIFSGNFLRSGQGSRKPSPTHIKFAPRFHPALRLLQPFSR